MGKRIEGVEAVLELTGDVVGGCAVVPLDRLCEVVIYDNSPYHVWADVASNAHVALAAAVEGFLAVAQ